MANQGFLSTAELDFNTLKANLRTFLTNQNALKDYNFEGSNLAVLLDLLAYNTYVNSHYLNMVGSEGFLDTAQLRESIVSHAKELNYTPRSRTSAKITGYLTVSPTNNPDIITVPKFYPIRATLGGSVYDFVTDRSYVIKNQGGSYVSPIITFHEGQIATEVFTVSNQKVTNDTYGSYIYRLSSGNIDIESIDIIVQESATDTTETRFTRADNLFGITKDSNVFFVEGYGVNRYQVVFGNDVIGNSLKNGNIVTINYRDTVGEDGNGLTTFTKATSIQDYTNIQVSVVDQLSYGGGERESVNDIKYNAPRYFQTQERAVTTQDYETIVKRNFPNVQAVIAYGGELASPKQYGKVLVAVKPYGTYASISNQDKINIVNQLKLKNITTEPLVVNPEYFNLYINSTVQYNSSLTTSTANDISVKVLANIVAMNNSTFTDFGVDLRYSKLLKLIDDSDDGIVSNNTEIRIVKRITPTVNVSLNTQIEFNNPLSTETILYEHPIGHDPIITTSAFTYTKNDIQYNAYITDNGLGILYLYTITADGTRLKLENNIGTVDYNTGSVEFTTTFTGYPGYISIYAKTARKDIVVSRNAFLIVDSNDVSVNVINEIQSYNYTKTNVGEYGTTSNTTRSGIVTSGY
jgi:hypothetical protein